MKLSAYVLLLFLVSFATAELLADENKKPTTTNNITQTLPFSSETGKYEQTIIEKDGKKIIQIRRKNALLDDKCCKTFHVYWDPIANEPVIEEILPDGTKIVKRKKKMSFPTVEISITPNPATDYVEIILKNVIPAIAEGSDEVHAEISRVNVYDVLGNVVLTQECHSCGSRNLDEQGEIPHQVRNDNSIRIDVSGLAAGVYFVRVGGRMYKFVKI